MYIKKLRVQNVKSLSGNHEYHLGEGVNFFAGDNNSGKSTILQAILFLFEGPTATRWTPETFYTRDATHPTIVEVDIAGNLDKTMSKSKYKKLEELMFYCDGSKTLRLQRSSEDRTVKQNGKDSVCTVKTICVWNDKTGQFENRTGIDALTKKLFDFEAVWADTLPNEHLDFANNKTLGRLLNGLFQNFTKTESWKNLAKAHELAFSRDDENSFLTQTTNLASQIKELVDEQYGAADYRFDFALPDANLFMKQGQLHVDDGTGETPVSGKGTGMQRAIALGAIQYYARMTASLDKANTAPLILMLDEPETWLHPNAQLKLGEALGKIGEQEQLFVITHSPYLLRKFDPAKHLLTVISGKGQTRQTQVSNKFGLFGLGEPTWGEINYRAFNLCSSDFHNELYGYIQAHLESMKANDKSASEKEIDNFLRSKGFASSKNWSRSETKTYDTTLPIYIRNTIHHPENKRNDPYTAEELAESTKALVELIEQMNAVN